MVSTGLLSSPATAPAQAPVILITSPNNRN
jgi:hypothetical protein